MPPPSLPMISSLPRFRYSKFTPSQNQEKCLDYVASQTQNTETAKMASGSFGPPNKCFASFSMEEIEAKQRELENKNSVASEEKAVKCFKSYLATLRLEDLDFFKYTEAELDYYLKMWYFNARTKKGEHYKSGTLNTLCYGLNRALKKYGHNFDIMNPASISFTKSIKAFEDACKKL